MEHQYDVVKLANGSKGLFIEVPGSKVVDFEIGFLAGFNYAAKKYVELPHVMEHTVFGANQKYGSMLEVSAAFEKNGAYNNAFTDNFLLGYAAECAVFEDTEILELLMTCITTARFLPAEVKSEISNVREELNSRISNHGTLAHDLLVEAMVGYRTDGTGLKSLPHITPALMRAHRDSTHSPKNMRYVFAGNLKNKAKLISILEQAGDKLGRGDRLKLRLNKPVQLNLPQFVHRDIPDIHYRFFQWFPEFDSEKERAAARIINAILTWRWKSWIFGEARRRGLSYSLSTGIYQNPIYNAFTLRGFVTPANIRPLFELASSKLKQARIGNFKTTEIEETKTYLIGSMLRAYKTPGNLLGWYGEDFITKDEIVDFHKTLEIIKSLSKNDIQQVAAQIFDQPLWGLSLVGNIKTQNNAVKLRNIFERIW